MKLRNTTDGLDDLDAFLADDDNGKVETIPVEQQPKPKPKPAKKPAELPKDANLEEVKKEILAEAKAQMDKELKSLAIEIDENCVRAIDKIVEHSIDGLSTKIIADVKSGLNLAQHIIKVEEKREIITDHPLHHEFDDVMTSLLECNDPVYLYGESGAGKTVLAQDIANAIGAKLFILSAQDMIGIFGYTDLNGVFHDTPFTSWLKTKEPAICYVSEADSIQSDMMLQLNLVLANKLAVIDNETITLAKDHYIIFDGNTTGNGASMQYQGRKALDGATLDRFVFFEIDYDRNIELFCAQKDEQLVEFIEAYRKICRENDIQSLATYRAISRIKNLEGKFGIEKAIQRCLTKGLMLDDLKAIQKKLVCSNKYGQAFKALTRG